MNSESLHRDVDVAVSSAFSFMDFSVSSTAIDIRAFVEDLA